MSVRRTEMDWETGISFRGFASVVSVILDEAWLLFSNESIEFQNLGLWSSEADYSYEYVLY